jgi:hypothetical protein
VHCYRSQFTTVLINSPGQRGILIRGNSARVGLTVNNLGGNAVRLSDFDGNDNFTRTWGLLNQGTITVLPFRDYGPLIQIDIWACHQGISTTFVVCEIIEFIA